MVTLWSSFFRSTLFERILTVIRIISRTGSTGRNTIPTQTSNNNKEISRHTHYQTKRTHSIVISVASSLIYLLIVCGWDYSNSLNSTSHWERERNKHRRSHKVRFERSSRSQFVSRFNKIFCVLVHNLFCQTKPNHNRMKIFRSKIYAHCPFPIPSAQKSTLLSLSSSWIHWNEWKGDIQ